MSQYYQDRKPYEKVSRSRVQAIRTLLPKKRPLKVLDVGCGAGTLGSALKKDPRITVFGVDVSPEAIANAREVLDDAWVGDIELGSLPKETGEHYDAVIASEVLEHLFDPEDLLRFLDPILTRGTPLIVTTPNILFWKSRLSILFGRFEYTDEGLMDRGHVHFFSWRALQDFFSDKGLAVTKTAHVVPTKILKPVGNLLTGLVAYQFGVLVGTYEEKK